MEQLDRVPSGTAPDGCVRRTAGCALPQASPPASCKQSRAHPAVFRTWHAPVGALKRTLVYASMVGLGCLASWGQSAAASSAVYGFGWSPFPEGGDAVLAYDLSSLSVAAAYKPPFYPSGGLTF